MLIWDNDFSKLFDYIKKQKEIPLILCDENTYEVCGKEIYENLGNNSKLLILPYNAHADEKHICKLLINTNDDNMIISVGSGSITDIARFVSYKQHLKFISVPTAPSMDGYASSVSALTIDGIKTTLSAKPPELIFANLEILKNAPHVLIKAGFGDLMGKYTALSDWRLAHILLDEPLYIDVAEEMFKACEDTLKSINKNDFIKPLFEGLIKSGELMTKVGNSRPASGAEHHIAHYLEFLGYDLFHGIKVGIATFYVIKLYEFILEFDFEKIDQYIDYEIDINEWRKEIEENFPKIHNRIIEENIERIEMFNNIEFRKSVIKKIKLHKDDIKSLAESLSKKKQEIIDGFEKIRFSLDIEDWNIRKEDLEKAILYSLFIRDRFTILTLYYFLGLLKNFIKVV
jgi:glycerol-1-phosphate dehydrogenase [NAD(P)+]